MIMLYKEFNAEVGKTLAAIITISDEDMKAAGLGYTGEVVAKFLESNPEYKGCSYTKEIVKDIWKISLWTTSEVVFKEV